MALTGSHTTPHADIEIAELSVGGLLQTVAARVPDKTAVIECHLSGDEGANITYADLLAKSTKIAQWLLDHYRPGDHIAVWAPNNLNWFLLQLGTSMAGMTLVTVNPSFLENEAEYVLGQSRSRAVFAAKEFRGRNLVDHATNIGERLDGPLGVHSLDEEVSRILADQASSEGAELPEVKPDDRCMIQYTSGTTGKPKGALLSHRAVVNYAKFSAAGLDLPMGSKWVNFMPMFHTGGCIYMALGCVWNEGQHLLLDGFEPTAVMKVVDKYKAHFIWSVPTMYFQMLELEDFDSYDRSSVIVIGGGATTIPPELVTRLEQSFGAEFVMLFGQTECGMASQTVRGDTLEHKSSTVGKAMPHVEMSIQDPESGAIKPIGEIGEICIRSVCVMDEYFERPEATARAVDYNGWLHMGDLGVMDEDGYCKITGRIKDMIIRGGENIFPREIEDVLITHEDILEVAVFGVPDADWGEQVAAAIRVKPGSNPEDEALMEFLREHIARHKVPRQWHRVDAFPTTASGKIQKFELQAKYSPAKA